MNIFVLSVNPKEAAEAHGDKHVIKMILESCQMLYTAHWIAAYPALLKERAAIYLSRAQKVLEIPSGMQTAPLRKNSSESGYRPVHIYHPCTMWVRECSGNYIWLADLALALADEYEFRWPGKVHSCKAHAKWLREHLPNIPDSPRNGFAVAMDLKYRVPNDPLGSYINFYKGSKKERNLTVYTRRSAPGFL